MNHVADFSFQYKPNTRDIFYMIKEKTWTLWPPCVTVSARSSDLND